MYILHIGPNKHWSIFELTPKEHEHWGFEGSLYVCVSRCIAWALWHRRHCHSLRAHAVTQTGLCDAILSTHTQWVGFDCWDCKKIVVWETQSQCKTMCNGYCMMKWIYIFVSDNLVAAKTELMLGQRQWFMILSRCAEACSLEHFEMMCLVDRNLMSPKQPRIPILLSTL